MANGKAKGSAFEREICKKLTSWVSGQEKPYIFWRMPASGGMATISEENKELSGDIISVKPEGAILTDKFSLECKCGYPNSSFDKHLKPNKKNEITAFWIQAYNDAKQADKIPMVIYKKTNHPILLGIPESIVKNFPSIKNIPSLSVKFEKETNLPPVTFFDFYKFFDKVTVEDIKRISK